MATSNAVRFGMWITTREGKRGWELSEWRDGAPHFCMWGQSIMDVRRQAVLLGATDLTLEIEGRLARDYKMPEGGYAKHLPGCLCHS